MDFSFVVNWITLRYPHIKTLPSIRVRNSSWLKFWQNVHQHLSGSTHEGFQQEPVNKHSHDGCISTQLYFVDVTDTPKEILALIWVSIRSLHKILICWHNLSRARRISRVDKPNQRHTISCELCLIIRVYPWYHLMTHWSRLIRLIIFFHDIAYS